MKKRMQSMEQEAALAYQAESADEPDRMDETRFVYEVKKTIVITVEAYSKENAEALIQLELDSGEYAYSFDKAEPELVLIDVEELK
jgi:hypothetical protein